MDCVFCKLVSGEFSCYKFWEDDEFMAILDIFPNTPGMALVISKAHYNSDIMTMPTDVYARFLVAAKNVVAIMKEKLKLQRVSLVIEGMGVDHAHIKLYPMHGLDPEFSEMSGDHTVFYDKYAGYITTLIGPKANDEDLQKMLDQLKS